MQPTSICFQAWLLKGIKTARQVLLYHVDRQNKIEVFLWIRAVECVFCGMCGTVVPRPRRQAKFIRIERAMTPRRVFWEARGLWVQLLLLLLLPVTYLVYIPGIICFFSLVAYCGF